MGSWSWFLRLRNNVPITPRCGLQGLQEKVWRGVCTAPKWAGAGTEESSTLCSACMWHPEPWGITIIGAPKAQNSRSSFLHLCGIKLHKPQTTVDKSQFKLLTLRTSKSVYTINNSFYYGFKQIDSVGWQLSNILLNYMWGIPGSLAIAF